MEIPDDDLAFLSLGNANADRAANWAQPSNNLSGLDMGVLETSLQKNSDQISQFVSMVVDVSREILSDAESLKSIEQLEAAATHQSFEFAHDSDSFGSDSAGEFQAVQG